MKISDIEKELATGQIPPHRLAELIKALNRLADLEEERQKREQRIIEAKMNLSFPINVL